MDFQEAIKALQSGCKVKRQSDNVIYYLDSSRNITVNIGYPQRMHMSMVEIEATDWEVYEEPKKTLSDKRLFVDYHNQKLRLDNNGSLIGVNSLKEALKEYMDCIRLRPNNMEQNYKDATEIFGSELLE